jgi:hypothetical protein
MSQHHDDEAMAAALSAWAIATPEEFDLRTEFTEQVLPLVKQAALACNSLGIPCHLAFAISRKDGVTVHNNTLMGAQITRLSPELLAGAQIIERGPAGFFDVYAYTLLRDQQDGVVQVALCDLEDPTPPVEDLRH